MKTKICILTILIMLMGASVFALDFLPKDTWPFVGRTMQRTGQNLDANNIDAANLDITYDYPSITEGTDFRIKTLADTGVTVGDGWIPGHGTDGLYQTDPDQIYSKIGSQKIFYYSPADITPVEVSYVEYEFTGLRPGDRYQCFMTVPCNPTSNETGYDLATAAYVRVEYLNQYGNTAATETTVNLTRPKYAASWLYCSGDIYTVGADGKLTIKISNRGKRDATVIEDDEQVVVSTECLVLADAVRIVRVPQRTMVGSAVACNFPGLIYELGSSFIVNGSTAIYNQNEYNRVANNFGMYVKNDADIMHFFMTRTKPSAVPNDMYVLRPDAVNPQGTFTYPFKVTQSGMYDIDLNVLTFATDYYSDRLTQGSPDSNSANHSLLNYNTQTYKIYNGDSLIGTVTVDMTNPGWNKLGAFELTAGADCKVVFEPTGFDPRPSLERIPKAYVMDAIKVTRNHTYDVFTTSDVGGKYVGVTAFNVDLVETPLGRVWSDDFMDSIGLQTWGAVGAFTLRSTQELWRYPDFTPADWDALEGPVPGGFATSPALVYMPDPVDNTKTILAALCAGYDGVLYAFDVTGTNPGGEGNARLIFKGPGIFLSEPEAGVGTSKLSGWSKSSSTMAAFGGTYLYTSNVDATPVVFRITDQMREKAGDYTLYSQNTSMSDFVGKKYTTFKWRVKVWIPPVQRLEGSRLKVKVTSFDSTNGKDVLGEYIVPVATADLGTWKLIDTNATFNAPSEVSIEPDTITDIACVDNIWLCPALPPGEELEFAEGSEIAVDIDKYGVEDSSVNTMAVSTVYAPTAAGRIFAYSLKDGVDATNKIAKLIWTFPKIDDRKTLYSSGTPSFIGQKILYSACPYNSTALWKAYQVGVNDIENYFTAGSMSNYYRTSGTIAELTDNTSFPGIARGGFMTYLKDKTGSAFSYSAMGNMLYKFRSSNEEESDVSVVGTTIMEQPSQTHPALVSYGNPASPTDKYVINDITGVVHSYDFNNSGVDNASAGFSSVKTGYYTDHIVSGIVTDGFINEAGQLNPNGYFGNNDGFMDVFDTVTGASLKRLMAGSPKDFTKSLITATPLVLAHADIRGEGIVNLNGGDGFNYTYSACKLDEGKTNWRAIHTGSNWEDILEEMEPIVVDPTDLAATDGVQVELIDYATAKSLIDLHKDQSLSDSIWERISSGSKEKLDGIPDNANAFIRKEMVVIPEEDWRFIQTGSDSGDVALGAGIDTELKAQRLSDYLTVAAQKCRMNKDWSGNNISGNDTRALFYEGSNAELGTSDPRKNNKGVTLEWGDHLYVLVWNIPDGATISGNSCITFEYSGGDVSLADRRTFNPKRKVPANITKVYNFNPYTVRFMDPMEADPDLKLKTIGLTSSTATSIKRRLSLVEFTLDCSHNKIQTMIGGGWTMGIDLQIPNLSSKVVRFPIARLSPQKLGSWDPYLETDESTWVAPYGFREKFTVNNPLSLKVASKEYGDKFTRYDDDNAYNGVKSADLQKVDLGDFGHGFTTALTKVATAANRGMADLASVRFYPGNHIVDESTHGQSGHNCNFVYDPMPWEYGSGSFDYPDIDYKNVTVVDSDGEDIIKYDTLLKAQKAWDTSHDTPYITGRSGNVKFTGDDTTNIRYQLDIPRYQPAMNNYVATAIVYCDSNSNGRFDQRGGWDNPGLDCEAYRRFEVTFDVGAEPEIYVDEDNITIGAAGHGVGYPLAINGLFTPYSNQVLGLQVDGNGNVINYNPYKKKPEIMRFFKPFKIVNEGNVNLYDISLNKEPLFALFGNANMSTFNEGIITSNYTGGWANALRIQENDVVSSLDFAVATDRMDGSQSVNFTPLYPFSSNGGNFGTGAGATLTITKARVGDGEGQAMSIPDTRKITGKPFAANNDYNRSFNANDFQLDVRDALDPMVGVSIPIGQPIGEYATRNPMKVSAKFGAGSTITSDTGIYLDVNVKEAQVTGIPYDKQSAHASLYHIGGDQSDAMNYYSYSDDRDGGPFAFQRLNNTVGLLWSNNKIAEMEDMTGEDINLSKMPLNIGIAELKGVVTTEDQVKTTNETDNFYNRVNWWNAVAMGIKDYGWPNDLPAGYEVPKWIAGSDIKSSYLQYPSYYTDGTNEKVVFAGKAELKKDGKILPGEFDNRIFFMDYAFSGEPEVTPLSHLDSYSEKKYPVMFMRGDKYWFLWQSNYEGKSSVSFTTDDIPNDYNGKVNGFSPEAKVRMPNAITSAGKPNVIDRNRNDNKIELIYTGVNKITGGTDVYMSQYSLDINTLDNKTFGLSEKALPLTRIYDEMRRDAKFDFFVGRGLAWARQDVTGTVPNENLPAVVVGLGGAPTDATHQTYIDVFTGNTVGFNEDDWKDGNVSQLPTFKSLAPTDGIYPKFEFDNATGVMTITYKPGSTAEVELGKTLIDFSSGVIRFTRIKDLAETVNTAGQSLYKKPVTVYASYVPQAISLTNGNGINDGGFATYDRDYDTIVVMWRKTGANTSNGVYYKLIKAYEDGQGRLTYNTVFADKKVETDASVTSINENSLSGFFDRRCKGENDGKGYGKLWLFWGGTKSGKSSIYYETDAIDEAYMF